MGTKMHYNSYFPGFYSMRDLNDDSSSSSWPVFYGDKMVAGGPYYNGFMSKSLGDGYSGHEKDTLKQKMLEHEAVFKNQVLELHRVYRIQRDMMEEFKRKELYTDRASMEPASSSSFQRPPVPSEEARKWHMAGFPLLNSSYGRISVAGLENFSSPTKNYEATDSRPVKVRKKLFDLQLPAEEYVDPEEEGNLQGYEKDTLYSRNGDATNGPENGVKFFLGSNAGAKNDRLNDASTSSVCLRGSIGLADLNEPIQIEEATAPSSIHFFGHSVQNGETKTTNWLPNSTATYLNVRDGIPMNSSIESQAKERGWLSHINGAGSSRGKLPLSSHPPSATYSSGYNREEKSREGFRHGLESSDRCCSRPPFFSSSSSATSWLHSISSWPPPSSSFPQKMETPAVAMTTHLQQSLEGNWHADYSSKLSRGFGSEPKSNEFYHVPSSNDHGFVNFSKNFSKLNTGLGSEPKSNGAYPAPSSNDHGFVNFSKDLYRVDSKPAIDINLNEAAKEKVILQDLNIADEESKPENDVPSLPWLKRKPLHVDKVTDSRRSDLSREASSNGLFSKNGTVRDLNQLYSSKLDKEITQPTVKKILGFPIFERDAIENELPSLVSSSMNTGFCTDERKKGMIDINVACEPDEQIPAEEPPTEKGNDEKVTPIKDQFDLNSCVSESEEPSPPCYDRNSANVKKSFEIDLEVPTLMESEDDSRESKEKNDVSLQSFDDQNKEVHDQVYRDAAETLVAISSYQQVDTEDSICLRFEASVEEALLWFAEVATTSGKESKLSEEIDDFEATTLQLVETKAENYMPKPFLPELQKVEEAPTRPLPTRTRRGHHSRRGRRWRDFQRDILPGLALLSRHEMTEDLQIFGGMMRATGHSWNSGPTRRNCTRNGGGRGRRRAVVEAVSPPLIEQLSTIEAGLEDRSLTGWGKTTRRPRQQRCSTGNPPTVLST